MFTQKSLYIGAHFWIAPLGAAFTSPVAANITQNGAWPDAAEPNWAKWAMGICESFEIDPKLATSEVILAPSPGRVQAVDEIIPYSVPEISFTLLQTDALAVQLALNTQVLANNIVGANPATPNGGGAPGIKAILKAEKYDQDNNLILNYQTWAFIKLKSALKGAPKTMTKPDFVATCLFSPNNLGQV